MAVGPGRLRPRASPRSARRRDGGLGVEGRIQHDLRQFRSLRRRGRPLTRYPQHARDGGLQGRLVRGHPAGRPGEGRLRRVRGPAHGSHRRAAGR